MLLETQDFFKMAIKQGKVSTKRSFSALGVDPQFCSRRGGLQELSPLSGAPALLAASVGFTKESGELPQKPAFVLL